MVEPFAERLHRNGTTARVTYVPGGGIYRPTMWPPLRDGHVFVGAPRAELAEFKAACTRADHLAHPDCDGSCPPWSADPKLSISPARPSGKPCPACGLPMTYDSPRRNSSVVINPWACENPECAGRRNR